MVVRTQVSTPDTGGCVHSETDTILNGKLTGHQTFCLNDPTERGRSTS
jgi:hypothetical protein